MFTPPNKSCFICHVSRVTCHKSRVTCHVSHVTCHIFSSSFFSDKVVKPIGGGSVINGAYPIYFRKCKDHWPSHQQTDHERPIPKSGRPVPDNGSVRSAGKQPLSQQLDWVVLTGHLLSCSALAGICHYSWA